MARGPSAPFPLSALPEHLQAQARAQWDSAPSAAALKKRLAGEVSTPAPGLSPQNAAALLEGEPIPAGPKRPTKHGNIRVTDEDGEVFDSKLEKRVAVNLREAYGRKRILRQVSLPLGDGRRMRPDFMIIHEWFEDGTFRAELADAKGFATKDWEQKARQLERAHGLKVRVIKKE